MDPRPATAKDYQSRILRVLIHIQQNLDHPGSLEELGEIALFSPFHFHRIFRGMVGESVMAHIRRLRLERSAHRLKFSDDQVIAIALGAGYESHEAFTRAFAAMFGAPPIEFRKTHRAIAYPAAPSGIHFSPDGPGAFTPAGGPPMQVRIERLPATRVAFIRHIGPYSQVGPCFGRLFAWAGPRGLIGPHTRSLGLCYDDPDVTPADKIRYDACITVGPAAQPDGEIGIQDIAAGEFAIATHQGSYTRLGETYAALFGQWLPGSGRAAEPPSMERYLSDPRTTPEAELLTEICIRLA